ncbi:hypothetical protein P3342_003847 [Pyrenophora teres f. teres]|nr:hypothetical protein P3342_003847 [Pyrenophora teres f. teres]
MNAPATPPPSHGKSPALSTDYGSDVSSEELDEIVQSQVLQSTPCPPKKSQDMDRSATPSPSQSRAPMTPLPASQPVSSQMSSQPTPSSPTVPRLDLFTQPSLGRSYSPTPSQPSPSKSMTPRMESFAQPYTPPSSKYTLSGLPPSPYQVPQYWPMQPSYSQPPSSRLPPEVAVYRFPSGQFQGKTILEAPLHYFLLLKKDDQLRNSMPGLTEAMHLIDQSSFPVTPMPTPYMAPTPPSYEYATLSSSQPLPHAYMMSAGPGSYQPVPQMHGIPAQNQHHPHIVSSSPTSSQHPYQDATPATPASSQHLPRQDMTDTPTSSQPSPYQDVKNTPRLPSVNQLLLGRPSHKTNPNIRHLPTLHHRACHSRIDTILGHMMGKHLSK